MKTNFEPSYKLEKSPFLWGDEVKNYFLVEHQLPWQYFGSEIKIIITNSSGCPMLDPVCVFMVTFLHQEGVLSFTETASSHGGFVSMRNILECHNPCHKTTRHQIKVLFDAKKP